MTDVVNDTNVAQFEEQFVAPGSEPEKIESVTDWFRKAVTLPKDDVTIYTDTEAAFEYVKVMDRQTEITSQMGRLSARREALERMGSTPSIADLDASLDEVTKLDEEYQAQQALKPALMERLNASGIVCSMRALYPAEIRSLTSIATREANATFTGSTPTDDEKEEARGRFLNAHYLSVSVQAMKTVGGGVLPTPVSPPQWLAIADTIDLEEYGKLVRKLNQLNMRAAVKDARTDAGFPG